MKTLYLMRHGQKELLSNKDDFDIELTAQGILDIKNMAKKLSQNKVQFDLIAASPALRAKQTAQIISEAFHYDKSIMYNEVIYQAFLNELHETITYTYDYVDSMLLIGHNPSLAALALTYCGYKEEFDMGYVLRIDFDCNSWIDIGKHNAKLIKVFKTDK
ncbi:phosphoglycerate mutase [Malaciobacter halophilus]|uniref:Phosphoglycerate mutase n=1 Tax=Malaciobacter halophilus TaxID=197482 RepID=A0A2N1J577_9BACT|nr:histidine phosphatase family protein [Malaciobacter halophilus]AXH10335.1 phosphohistidine phosphatase [Malaciobacter halophilus]PKI81686.1 phosphoglycerate mutase [Malaciobacter halophilus]